MIYNECMGRISKCAIWYTSTIERLAKCVWYCCWRFQKQTSVKILSFFCKSRWAVDLHEESRFIAEGIFTNSITQPCPFKLYYV